MSKHSHPHSHGSGHDHDHDHDHDPNHEHCHSHDHPHDHAKGDARGPGGGGPDPAGTTIEDASTLALSDALRSSFRIIKLLMILLVAAFAASGVFTVKPNQVAIKLRFGKPVGVGSEQVLKPGLHWAFPYPIDEIVYVPVGESRTLTSTKGWYYVTPEEEAGGLEPAVLGSLRPGLDGYALTGDGNIIHVRATLNYRITDPVSYAFNVANITNLLEHAVDNALAHAAARYTADDALYRNKLGFQEALMSRLNRTLEQLQLGITVEPREVRTSAPLYVRSAFDEVLKAQQQGDIKVQEAETYARGATNKAVGEASAILRDGLTRSNYLVQTVAAEAKKFNDLLPRYQADPGLFRQRLLTETAGRVLTNAQFKAFLAVPPNGRPWELRLQLAQEPEVPVKQTAQP
jgi:membrane protease subunit HflK